MVAAKKNEKGLFIVFEGLDKSGKTTLANQAAEKLREKTRIVYQKGLGSGTWIGKIARRYPSTLLFLAEIIYLSCKNHFRMKRGTSIVQDRYFASVACHLPASKKIIDAFLLRMAGHFVISPDVLVYCMVSKEKRLERLLLDSTENRHHRWLIDHSEYIDLREEANRKYFERFAGSKIIIDTTDTAEEHSAADIIRRIDLHLTDT